MSAYYKKSILSLDYPEYLNIHNLLKVPNDQQNHTFLNLQRELKFFKDLSKNIKEVQKLDREIFDDRVADFTEMTIGFFIQYNTDNPPLGDAGFFGYIETIKGLLPVYELNTRIDVLTKRVYYDDNISSYLVSQERHSVINDVIRDYFSTPNTVWVYNEERFNEIFNKELNRINTKIQYYEDQISDIYLSFFEPWEEDGWEEENSEFEYSDQFRDEFLEYKMRISTEHPIYKINHTDILNF
jgi:hypothetical protein